VNLVVACGP